MRAREREKEREREECVCVVVVVVLCKMSQIRELFVHGKTMVPYVQLSTNCGLDNFITVNFFLMWTVRSEQFLFFDHQRSIFQFNFIYDICYNLLLDGATRDR